MSKLHIYIYSFSYRNGFPVDDHGHGGGFVFDCRGIHNPGRFEPYKKLTGRDQAVKDFLVEESKIEEFLDEVFPVVERSVKKYIDRGFDGLSVYFGCTGGQHRSVYSADALARYLSDNYDIEVEVHHIEQEKKNWIN